MATKVIKLKVDATEIELQVLDNYSEPDEVAIIRKSALDGTEYSYKRYIKRVWLAPIEFISNADATNINTWWEDLTTVTLYPDLINSPATTFSVRIRNQTKPLASFKAPFWQENFKGTLRLRE